MAWLEKRKDTWHINFFHGGRHYSRSLKTKNQRKAEGCQARLEENLADVERGRLDVPLARIAHRVFGRRPSGKTSALLKGVGRHVADLGRRNFFERVLALLFAGFYGPSARAVAKQLSSSCKGSHEQW